MVPVNPVGVLVLFALMVVADPPTCLSKFENCSVALCPDVLKSCAGVLIAHPFLVLGVEVAESFARGVWAAVLSASYVEDLPAAVAACLGVDDRMYV